MKSFRHALLLLIFSFLPALRVSAQSISLQPDGDHMHVKAPQLHFLSGKAVEKLRNGSAVTYIITLAATPSRQRKAALLAREKFVVSFDLWEEKYSVVQDKSGGRAASHLASDMAEAWCLDNMPIPVRSIPDRQPFMIRLECFIEESEGNESGEGYSGLTLAAIIDVFSRKKREEPLRWEAAAGPFLLDDLKKTKQTR